MDPKSLSTSSSSACVCIDINQTPDQPQEVELFLPPNVEAADLTPWNVDEQHDFDLNEPAVQQQEEHHHFDLNEPAEDDSDSDVAIEWLDNDSDAEVEQYDWTDEEEEPHAMQQLQLQHASKRRKIELSNFRRAHVANKLQQVSDGSKLPHGTINKLATEFGVSRWTVSRIWKLVSAQMSRNENIIVDHKKTGRVGRKRVYFDPDVLKSVPLHKRTSIRSVALALGIHRSTLYRLVKRGAIRKHSNAIKPDLTIEHRVARVLWCLNSIVPATLRTFPQFKRMYNVVHIDEKWFCMSKRSVKYYLAPDEKDPRRTCKSKRFILKVMFLACIARPHITPSGEVVFDGKIGIFPFIELVPAKRSSKNRARGTLETKPQRSITKEVIKAKLIEKVLPQIRNKWPQWGCKQIWVIQDNAKPHIQSDDAEFMQEGSKDGFDIGLVNQPAQSPDLNVLDLGFFRAIQSLKDQISPKQNVDKLVKAVEDAYDQYDPKLINNIFLTLQSCMGEILKVKGCNNYKIPHMHKEALERQGALPTTLHIPTEVVEECEFWLENGSIEDANEAENGDNSDDDSDDGIEVI